MLVWLYNMYLCYATTLIHYRKLLHLASPSPAAGRFADPPTSTAETTLAAVMLFCSVSVDVEMRFVHKTVQKLR